MSPRVTAEERRAQILEAAMACFLRSGYRDTSMDDIVNESGLSKGTLYWHFKNKQELFGSLFEQLLTDLTIPFHEALDQTELSVIERFKMMGRASVMLADASEGFLDMPVNFLVEMWLEPDFAVVYQQMIKDMSEHVEKLLQEGIDNGELGSIDVHNFALGLMATLDGIFLYHMMGVPGNVNEQIDVIIDALLEGIKQRDK